MNDECACDGRGWLIMATNGDDSRDWVERCDECQYFGQDDPRSVDDEDAALVAAQQLGRRIGWATPAGCDHEHPYLVNREN